MVRYAKWQEAVDPERPLERFDPLVRLGWSLLAGAGGLAFCVCGAVPATLIFWRMVGRDQGFRRVERLRDHPARFLQVACRLILVWEGVVYGWDEGLLAVTEDSIVYEGRRTSFSVPRHGEGPYPEGGTLRFSFETPAGLCEAWIEAFDRRELREARQTWPPSEGSVQSAVYPPFVPEARTLRQTDRFQVFTGLALASGLTAAPVAALAYSLELGVALALGSAGVAAISHVHACRRRRALMRLTAIASGRG